MSKLSNQPTLLKEEIRSLGLNEKEAIIYVALLEIGGAYPSKIAEAIKMNRTTTYAILTDLAVKGLVSELKRRNKLYYQIEKPNKLLRYTKERVRIAEDAADKAEKIIPELEGLFSLTPNKPKIRFFEGYPEVLGIHEDHTNVEKRYEQMAWANGKAIAEFLPADLRKKYLAKKASLKITTRVILPNTPEDRKYKEITYKSTPKNIWPERKYVSADKFPYPAEITIYGTNKISILNFSQEKPVGIIIEDQIIHDMMVMIFNLSWKGAKD